MNLVLGKFHFPCDGLFTVLVSKSVQPTKFSIRQQTTTCSVFQNSSVFASQEKNKEQIITCGISKWLYVGLQLSQLSLENMVSLPTFIRMEIGSGGSRHHWLDTCSFGKFWGGAGQLWRRDVTLDNAPWWFIFGRVLEWFHAWPNVWGTSYYKGKPF